MSDSFFIAPIVEGHGDVQAVPVLLRRFAADASPPVELRVNPPLRIRVGSFLRDEAYFRKYVELAARKAKLWPKPSVLILLDCEDACPLDLGPRLLEQAAACRSDVRAIVILAYREYETWFVAAAKSLRGVCGLPSDLEPPDVPESVRDAKGWLAEKMGVPYNEPDHQPRLTAKFAFHEAVVAKSFARGREKFRELFC